MRLIITGIVMLLGCSGGVTHCPEAGKHLEELGCKDELYVEDNDETTHYSKTEDWVKYCETTFQLDGLQEPTKCLLTVQSCDEIDGCYHD